MRLLLTSIQWTIIYHIMNNVQPSHRRCFPPAEGRATPVSGLISFASTLCVVAAHDSGSPQPLILSCDTVVMITFTSLVAVSTPAERPRRWMYEMAARINRRQLATPWPWMVLSLQCPHHLVSGAQPHEGAPSLPCRLGSLPLGQDQGVGGPLSGAPALSAALRIFPWSSISRASSQSARASAKRKLPGHRSPCLNAHCSPAPAIAVRAVDRDTPWRPGPNPDAAVQAPAGAWAPDGHVLEAGGRSAMASSDFPALDWSSAR